MDVHYYVLASTIEERDSVINALSSFTKEDPVLDPNNELAFTFQTIGDHLLDSIVKGFVGKKLLIAESFEKEPNYFIRTDTIQHINVEHDIPRQHRKSWGSRILALTYDGLHTETRTSQSSLTQKMGETILALEYWQPGLD